MDDLVTGFCKNKIVRSRKVGLGDGDVGEES